MSFENTKAAIKIYKEQAETLTDDILTPETQKEVEKWLRKWDDLDQMVANAYWMDTMNVNSKENCMRLTAEGTIRYLKRIGELGE